jgi:hypothetical protein
MPNAKPKTKSRNVKAAKPTRAAKSAARKPSASALSVSSRAAVDPKVLAAISLALEDERVASERAEQLDATPSGWVAMARVRPLR